MHQRYAIGDVADLASPALLFFKQIIGENLTVALDAVGGDPSRLRPHVKTHKTLEIVEWELKLGITKHKCATLREAQLLCEAGVPDVLVAYPIIGPNLDLLADLIQRYPDSLIQCTVDSVEAARGLSATAVRRGIEAHVFVDLDVGMHRTGVPVGAPAEELCDLVAQLPALQLTGLHAYDGHNTSSALDSRQALGQSALAHVRRLRDKLVAEGASIRSVVMGGTPNFPVYAREADIEASPGTFVLHDAAYYAALPDLGFTPAAILFSRVVSRTAPDVATIDLGHKAVGADPRGDRGTVLNVSGARVGAQHEEHWVLELTDASTHALGIGDAVYVCPTHVCPTVALHSQAHVVDGGRIVGTWDIAARERPLR